MAAEKLAAKRHSLFTAFSGESETGSESVLGDCNHGRDSSKHNNKFDRQVPNVPNCKLTDAHELNPTICSRRSAQDVLLKTFCSRRSAQNVSPHTW
jgi:hypothetical protein